MLRFRQMKSIQKFVSVHANVHNHFNLERHLINRQTYKTRRSTALAEWQPPHGLKLAGEGESFANRRRVAVRLTAPFGINFLKEAEAGADINLKH